MTLAVVCDLDRGRADSLASRFRAEVSSDWRGVLARVDIDAVIVSTPPSSHAEISIEASRAGKHVLCEKPLARNAEECRRMLAAAQTSGKLLATGFNYRFYPSVLKARELLDSGIIGELSHIRSYAGYSATSHNQQWLHDIDVMGGGALRDNGIHLIDLTCYFLGDVAAVQGDSCNSVWRFPSCEDNGFALIRNSAGKIATLHASWSECQGYRFQMELHGTLGCISLSCFPMVAKLVHAQRVGGPVRRRSFYFPAVHFMEHLKSYRWVVVRSFVQELSAFHNAAAGGRTALATGADGLRAIEVAEAATLSSPEPRHAYAE
jgi:predicted dehydrogenase